MLQNIKVHDGNSRWFQNGSNTVHTNTVVEADTRSSDVTVRHEKNGQEGVGGDEDGISSDERAITEVTTVKTDQVVLVRIHSTIEDLNSANMEAMEHIFKAY